MAERGKRPAGDRVAEPGVPYGRAATGLGGELLEVLQTDLAVRTQVAALLGVPAGLPEALHRLADELRAQREEGDKRFQLILERFEAVDRRFEAVDRRFEAVDRRFEKMDRRFEAMDRRFEELRADMNARFEAMDRRFEAMDRRFEELRADMNARFEAVDRRFEAMDGRFEELRADMNARFEAVDRRFEVLSGQLSLATLNVGRFVQHGGHRLEDVVAGALRFALHRPDILPSSVRLRQEFVDAEGKFGEKGRKAEVDVVAADDKTYLLEVKASAKQRDVRAFAEDVEFVARMMGLAPGTYAAVLATVDKSEAVKEACRVHGVILV